MAKTSATTEFCGRPFSACYTPQTAHSLTGKVSYHRGSLEADTPAYLLKFVRAKDQAPVVPVQISEVISPHLARVSFGDGRVDTVSTSDLSRQPPDVDNEETISQPVEQCRDKETNVDPDIGTQCEPTESVESVKGSQVSPDSPAPTLRRSARNRKPPTYLGDFVLTTN